MGCAFVLSYNALCIQLRMRFYWTLTEKHAAGAQLGLHLCTALLLNEDVRLEGIDYLSHHDVSILSDGILYGMNRKRHAHMMCVNRKVIMWNKYLIKIKIILCARPRIYTLLSRLCSCYIVCWWSRTACHSGSHRRLQTAGLCCNVLTLPADRMRILLGTIAPLIDFVSGNRQKLNPTSSFPSHSLWRGRTNLKISPSRHLLSFPINFRPPIPFQPSAISAASWPLESLTDCWTFLQL